MARISSGAMDSPFLMSLSSLKASMPCFFRAPKRKAVKLLRVSSPRKLTNTSYWNEEEEEEEVHWMMALEVEAISIAKLWRKKSKCLLIQIMNQLVNQLANEWRVAHATYLTVTKGGSWKTSYEFPPNNLMKTSLMLLLHHFVGASYQTFFFKNIFMSFSFTLILIVDSR